MKLLATVVSILLSIGVLQAQGIEFFHGTWEEAIAASKAEEKPIFVDAFATWCGPCKRMARDVFPNEKVGAFFNRHFINMKLDMERGQGLEFRKEYPVSAFPTLFFIDGNGEVVHKTKGAKGVDQFLELGRKVMSMADRSGAYAERYEAGERDPELMYKYVKALNNAGKPSQKIANEYLATDPDLSTEPNLLFLIEATTQADSKAFSLLADNKAAAIAVSDEQTVTTRMAEACKATLAKAIEFESEDLLEEAQDKMAEHCPDQAEDFAYTSAIEFYRTQRDADNYAKACKKYAKKAIKEQPTTLHKLAVEMHKAFRGEPVVMKEAELIAEQAVDQQADYQSYATYARILKDNNKKEAAIEAAEKALELAQDKGPYAVRMMESFLKQVKS